MILLRAVLVISFISGLVFPMPARDVEMVFEGDMIMKVEEVRKALNGEDLDAPTGRTRALTLHNIWPNAVVPYLLSSSVKNSFLNLLGIKGPTEKAILSAIKEWELKTCVKFVPRTNQTDFVEFVDAGFGKCFSHVGRVGGVQKISLGFGCFSHGIAVHEIGHAVGFFHEQSRTDRDNYVEIIWDNIKPDAKFNFRKYGRSMIDSLGVPYDYGSIMHYGKRDFAKWPWLTTIRPKKSGVSIGQRSHLSALDVEQANLLYNCP